MCCLADGVRTLQALQRAFGVFSNARHDLVHMLDFGTQVGSHVTLSGQRAVQIGAHLVCL